MASYNYQGQGFLNCTYFINQIVLPNIYLRSVFYSASACKRCNAYIVFYCLLFTIQHSAISLYGCGIYVSISAVISIQEYAHIHYLHNVMLRISRIFLESRENIKTSTHPSTHGGLYRDFHDLPHGQRTSRECFFSKI